MASNRHSKRRRGFRSRSQPSSASRRQHRNIDRRNRLRYGVNVWDKFAADRDPADIEAVKRHWRESEG